MRILLLGGVRKLERRGGLESFRSRDPFSLVKKTYPY